MFSGCIIKGRIVDQYGFGLGGVTVMLSGDRSMAATSNSDGYFQFGTLSNMLPVGSYAVTPSRLGCTFTPAINDNITIATLTLEGLGDVPQPVSDINFQANCTMTFSTSDLAGTWHGHGLSSGLGSENNGWVIYTLVSDTSGNISITYTESEGDSGTTSGKINISNNGILTDSEGGVFQGVMNNSKNIIVATDTWDPGENALTIFVKDGGHFSTSDLAGPWYGHALESGSQSMWVRYTLISDVSGNVSITVTESEGDTGTERKKISIANNGILTLTGASNFHGVMNSEKNIVVATNTPDPGEFALIVFVKGGGQFSTSDLAGTWYGHSLESGSGNRWGRITMTADNSGDFTATDVDSEGDSGSGGGKISISNGGILTIDETQGFLGVIGNDKSIIVATENEDPGEYIFDIFIKR